MNMIVFLVSVADRYPSSGPPAYTCTPLGCQDYNGIYPDTLTPLGNFVGYGLGIFFALVIAAIVFFSLVSIHSGMQRRTSAPQTLWQSTEYRMNRERVMRVYGRRCSVCGSMDRVEMHHIVPRSRGGSHQTSNLVPLCHYHHEQVHGRRFGRRA